MGFRTKTPDGRDIVVATQYAPSVADAQGRAMITAASQGMDPYSAPPPPVAVEPPPMAPEVPTGSYVPTPMRETETVQRFAAPEQKEAAVKSASEMDKISNEMAGLEAERQRLANEQSNTILSMQQGFDEAQAKYMDIQAKRQDEIREASQKYQTDVDELAKQKPETLFQRSKLAGIMAAVGSAMGSYAATIGRTQNFAGDLVSKIIEQDWEEQKAQYMSARDKTDQKRTVVNDLVARSKDEGEAFQKLLGAKYQSANMMLAGLEAKTKNLETKARLGEIRAGLIAKRNEILGSAGDQIVAKTTEKTLPAGFERKDIDAKQWEAADFGHTMNQSLASIESAIHSGFNPGGSMTRLTSNLAPEVREKAQNQYEAAKSAFIGAYLRDISGAAIPEFEESAEGKRILPQPGDDEDAVKAKLSVMKGLVANRRAQAGNAWSIMGAEREKTQKQYKGLTKVGGK